ncbi:Rhodanese-related sulfurtransferase [Paenibacillus uliginis N3/975]|uniref:Rhodanese-related sulfurtransferase n=1 Tax=Paenibacillus uliginis N3/975 TaxID=1313296 RepID=A0A1X7HQZ5_9BACL|nr:sulfurtransferase TusA family protein [Paenibacillus uliginis]SMF91384.1 Rhodanese-related sulfurtransferase [Paenibacillus uliginis N3/975]
MKSIDSNVMLDAKGLACPMPIVRTKKAMKDLEGGQVLEVEATDKGSKADMKAWAESTGHQYLGTIEEGDVLKHYLRKSSGEETAERSYPHVTDNTQLEQKLQAGEPVILLDVRESAEYAFKHIPNAISIPLGDLDNRLEELNKQDEIYVVCRTGTRSDMAAQKLAASGFDRVINVVPGMSGWTGTTTSSND